MNSESNHLMQKQTNWSRLLLILWIYTLMVILWGAWVRISHSGDGCGDHWPLCAGEYIPDFAQKKTWIEYAHRMMSGVYGLFVIGIFIKFRKHQSAIVRKLNFSLLILMSSEALLGAVLVKGHLVTLNDSVLRLLTMSLHQLNSFLLTGVTYLFYISLKEKRNTLNFQSPFFLGIFILLPISGAIAALSSTLFPSISLFQGVLQDFSGETHLFLRLRIIHPLLASVIAVFFINWLFSKNLNRLAFEFIFAVAVGVITLITLSPSYLKLTHLLIAHVLWARMIYTLVNLPDSNKR